MAEGARDREVEDVKKNVFDGERAREGTGAKQTASVSVLFHLFALVYPLLIEGAAKWV